MRGGGRGGAVLLSRDSDAVLLLSSLVFLMTLGRVRSRQRSSLAVLTMLTGSLLDLGSMTMRLLPSMRSREGLADAGSILSRCVG